MLNNNKEKTLDDIYTNQVLCTDRIEVALEKLCSRSSLSDALSKTSRDEMMYRRVSGIEEILNGIKLFIIPLVVGIIFLTISVCTSLAAMNDKLKTIASGFEQSTSTEEEVSPETTDQSSLQSSVDEHRP